MKSRSNGGPSNGISYQDAADMIGCDHHWVRMMTGRGRFEIVDRVEVRPNVLKVFIDRAQVEAYIETRRNRKIGKVQLTEEEWVRFENMFGRDKIRKRSR